MGVGIWVVTGYTYYMELYVYCVYCIFIEEEKDKTFCRTNKIQYACLSIQLLYIIEA